MLNTWRGLMLAAGVAAIPAFAQAECPPPDSIDRYAQTAGDALVALDGLVPEEQQQALEDRYVAMSILRWSWQGRDAILNESSALDAIAQCIDSGRCDALDSERAGAGPRTISAFPSDRLVSWANRQIECDASASDERADAPESASDPVDPASTDATEAEADTALDNEAVSEPAPVPETVETPETAIDETLAAAEPTVEPILASDDVIAPETEFEDDLATDMPLLEDITDIASPEIESAATSTVPASTPESEPMPASAPMVVSGGSAHLIRAAVVLVMRGNVPDGIETFSKACYKAAEQSDPAQSCELIFDHYDRLGVRADPTEFLAFTDQLCRLNYLRGCSSLATYFGVETTTEAHVSALRFYDRACNSGDAEACAAASDYYLTGRAERADPVRARETLYRACDLGSLASCQPLAEFFARGVGGDVDLDRAIELNDVSCSPSQTRSAETCVAAADFVLLNLPEGAERDEKVRTYTARACRIGHDTGCAWHADNLEFGIGGAVDTAGAEQARQRACALGHEASCDATS